MKGYINLMHSKTFGTIIRPQIVVCIVVLSVLSGCSFLNLFGKQDVSKATPEGIYAMASEEYQKGNYEKAREHFLRVKEQYPLHEMSVLAEIGVADSFYSEKEYAEAEGAYGDFISLHPVNENVPYAIYQMGMCHYNQMEAIDRDQTETMKARNEWEKLMARYPASKFSIMAEKMLRDVKQRLAQREFYIGNFYLTQKKYKAALARFEKIANDYNNVGLDYKIEYYINETKTKLTEAENIKSQADAEKKHKEEALKKKEEEKIKKDEADKKKQEEEQLSKEADRKKIEEEKLKQEAEKQETEKAKKEDVKN